MDVLESQQDFKIGSRVIANIVQIDHYGIHVQVNDQIDGYVKRSEALLSLKIVDLKSKFSIGQKVPAIVQGYSEKYKSLKLSFKQAQADPWEAFIQDLQEGIEVEGQVVIITESKAIVEIEPGITGILAKNELWIKAERVDDVLMVNDRVRAQVVKIFPDDKMLWLSVRRMFADEKDFDKAEETTYAIEESLSDALKIYRWEQEKQTQQNLVFSQTFQSAVRKITVLDADDSIAEPMMIMMNNLGVQSGHIKPEQIESTLKTGDVDFIILSCVFLEDRDLVPLLIEFPVLVYGSNDQLSEYYDLLLKYNLLSSFLPVPHSADELVEKLNDIITGVKAVPKSLNESSGEFDLSFDEGVQQSVKDLDQLLHKIKELSGASYVIVFQMNLNSLETDIYAIHGAEITLTGFDKGHLQFSPISDVIIDGDFVLLSHEGLLLKYMNALDRFDSLSGIRIEFTDECGYGLFLFGKHAAQFAEMPQTFMSFCEMAVRANIEQNKFLERRCNEQKFILTGKLTAGLVHEIKNQLQAMQYWLEIMKTDSVNLNNGKLKGTDKAFLARFEQSVNGAQNVEKRTRNVEEMFLNLLRKETEKTIQIDKFIDSFIETVRPIAKKHKIQIDVQAEKGIRAHVDVSMLNQVLVNLYLNSIDFMSQIRKQTGKIEISAKKCENEARPLVIEFKDNGPGINEKLKEKVFELLYTTKSGGSGLGLGISRKMAEKMGGRLYIRETFRLGGTTFWLELPLKQEG